MILWLLACQPLNLSQEWELDRARVLAIRAEPAEPRPGDTVAFSSLTHALTDAPSAIWLACVAGTDFGCPFDPAVLEGLEDMSPEEQQAALEAAGLIGVEPGLPPVWRVPEDALAGLDEAQALEGVSATVQVTFTDGDDTELVVRRIPISLASTPNHNPDIARIEVDGVAADGVLSAAPGETYALEAVLAEGAVETYDYVTTEGVAEVRTEEPAWRWYASVGTLGGVGGPGFGGDEDPERDAMSWTAPDGRWDGVLHAVVLDRRGGMGWATLTVEVR